MTREEYSKLIKELAPENAIYIMRCATITSGFERLNHTGQVEKMNWLIPWRRNLLSE